MTRHTITHVLLSVVAIALLGCSVTSPSGTSRLRVANKGSVPIQELTLLFPKDQISFGNVAAGATTPYRDVPNGVYRYSAFRFTIGGATVNQPVIDWVGEEPMDGKAFTYHIDADANRLPVIRIVNVTRDE
jgi:hypothetical protein